MDNLILLAPPLLALLLAIYTRHIYIALFISLVLSESIIVGGNPALGFLGSIDRIANTFTDSGNTNIFLFCLLIGVLIVYMRDSGGVTALAHSMIRGPFSKTRRRAELSVASVGSGIFIETNISLLGTGILGRTLYDAHKLSRERLAYIIDSTSSPISVILLLNAWGAYADRLIEPFGFENSTTVVVGSVGWNFYAFLAIALVFFVAVTGKAFGPLRNAQYDSQVSSAQEKIVATKPLYMWLPIVFLIGGAFFFMYWTGRGNITAGSGSQSILWAITITVILLALLLRLDKVFSGKELQEKAFSGIGEMVPMVAILLLAIAFGASIRELGTGQYIADLGTAYLPTFAIPALLFFIAGIMSFVTGTSWGTYGILIPIAMPLSIATGLPPSLALGAVLGGGVFGDHCSPISDTTLIASLASGCDHISHVVTQLPYALFAALVAIALYLAAGLWVV